MKTARRNDLPVDKHMMFETCRRHQILIKILIWKVWILLVYVT